MALITKVTFDSSEEMILNPQPLEILDSDDEKQRWIKKFRHREQFERFTEKVLRKIDYDVVEDFAKDEFDLVDEFDAECDDDHLDSCSDDELLQEAKHRGLVPGYPQNILNADFALRFAKIVEAENPIMIEQWLTEMESKFCIVT